MSDVTFQREHTLGLIKARALATDWAAGAAKQMGLDCKHEQGAEQDTLTFERMGVHGVMSVTATHLDVQIKLGMLMAAFKPIIESEIASNLGAILEKAAAENTRQA
jgi:putative polyhydroxyalkanoate system protein